MNNKLSIIVPIYNMELYIARCIESVLQNNSIKFELILIDDGSKDKSLSICRDYEKIDNRVKVYYKQNSGVSETRNYGLLKAQGEYVMFVDADDYVDMNAVEEIITKSSSLSYEVLIGKAIQHKEQNLLPLEYSIMDESESISGMDFLKYQLTFDTMHMFIWINLYQREFLIRNEYFFNSDLKQHEDELWVPQVFIKANKVKFTNILFYHYTYQPNSLSNTKKTKVDALNLINHCTLMREEYQKLDNNIVRELLCDRLVEQMLWAIQFGSLYGRKYKESYNLSLMKQDAIRARTKKKVKLIDISPFLYFIAVKLNKLISFKPRRLGGASEKD